MITKILLFTTLFLVFSCGPSSTCQNQCKDVVDKFGCECRCSTFPSWRCGNFDSEECENYEDFENCEELTGH